MKKKKKKKKKKQVSFFRRAGAYGSVGVGFFFANETAQEEQGAGREMLNKM